jgi:hypothetical protein
MRLAVMSCAGWGRAGSIGLALCGCASAPPPIPHPLSVQHGLGSEHGNYAAQADAEMRGPDGERCVVFSWDRPLSDGLVVRLRSASCESKEHPGWMTARELSRTIIPMAQSHLPDEADDDGGR